MIAILILIKTPNIITGTGLIDLPITCVGYDICCKASLLDNIATTYVKAQTGYIHFLVVSFSFVLFEIITLKHLQLDHYNQVILSGGF